MEVGERIIELNIKKNTNKQKVVVELWLNFSLFFQGQVKNETENNTLNSYGNKSGGIMKSSRRQFVIVVLARTITKASK